MSVRQHADHQAFLLHSVVEWLSRGRVLKRACNLRSETVIFLRQQNFMALAEKFSQKNFNTKIAYFADILYLRASASQSVDLGFIPYVESYQKTLKTGIHSFPDWRSA